MLNYKGITTINQIELGSFKVGAEIIFSVPVKSSLDCDIDVRAVPTCGCTTLDNGVITLLPGQEHKFEVKYSKTEKVGEFSKAVHLFFGECDDNTTSNHNRKITVTFKGTINP